MGANSTVYDVRVKYSLEDKLSTGLRPMSAALDDAEKRTRGLSTALLGIGAAVGSTALLAGKKFFVDANREVEDLRIGLSGILELNLGGSFDSNRKKADALFATYQQRAKTSTATTREFIEMNNSIAPALLQAGLGMSDLADYTTGAVVASKALGERADLVALDITQALNGTLNAKDRFAKALLSPLGLDAQAFNAKSAKERASILGSQLNSKALRDAAKAQEQSFSGVTSTFVDTLEIGLREVGLPLFREMTKEVARWNAWITKHPKEIASFAKTFSSALSSGFEIVRSTVSFIVEHKDLLLALAAVWGASKVGGAVLGSRGIFGGTVDGEAFGAGGKAKLLASMALGNVDPREKSVAIGSMRANIGALGGAGFSRAGFRNLLRQELYTVSQVGAPSSGALLAGGLRGFALASATGMGPFATAVNTAVGALGSLPGPIGLAANAFSLVLLPAISAFVDWLEKRRKEKAEREEAFKPVAEAARLASTDPFATGSAQRHAMDLARFREEAKLAIEDPRNAPVGAWNAQTRMAQLATAVFSPGSEEERLAGFAEKMKLVTTETGLLADNAWEVVRPLFNTRQETAAFVQALGDALSLRKELEDLRPREDSPKSKKDRSVNVTIQKIEVASDDPDRFVFGVVHAAEEVAANPTQARRAMRGIG